MKLQKVKTGFILALMILVATACKHDPVQPGPIDENPCDTTNVTFDLSVKPILENNCYSCHNSTSTSGGYNFTDYDQLALVASNGRLLGSINHQQGFSAMPQGGKLSDCDIAIITKWVNITNFPDPDPDPDPDPAGCDPDTVYFQNEILPLLISSCGVIGCHDPGTAEKDVVLTDYFSVINTAEVKPGDPDESKLYKVITDDDPEDRMPPPPNEPMSQDKIEKIRKWILQGAKNNSCEETQCDTTVVSFSNHIMPVINLHCFGCHSGSNPGGGILMTNHNQIAAAANSGKLMGSISWQNGFSPMPKNGNQLSICHITQFKKWIENGTPNN